MNLKDKTRNYDRWNAWIAEKHGVTLKVCPICGEKGKYDKLDRHWKITHSETINHMGHVVKSHEHFGSLTEGKQP